MSACTWHVDSVELLRNLIGDVEDTPIYSDERLTRVLIAAAFQLTRELSFEQEFVVSISGQTITPDPTDIDGGTSNPDFINLMVIKAACIIDTGSAISAANNAFAGKDKQTSWDFKGKAQSTLALLEKGWCAAYKMALDDYLYGNNTLCAAVTGPFRAYSKNFRLG